MRQHEDQLKSWSTTLPQIPTGVVYGLSPTGQPTKTTTFIEAVVTASQANSAPSVATKQTSS